jgi:hypothetical protein
MGFKMMWQNVLRERDPYKQNSMIKDILLLKPYLNSYYEATKLIFDNKNQGYDNTVMVKNNNNNEDKAEDYNVNRKF